MDTSLLLLRLAVGFYVGATGVAFASLALKRRRRVPWTPVLAGIGFLAHLVHLVGRGIMLGGVPVDGYPDLLSLLCWAAILVYLISFIRTGLDILGVIILPLVLVLFSVTNLLPMEMVPVSEDLEGVLRNFHIFIAVLGSAALFLTFAASVLYLVQERGLKEKRPARVGAKLPSLERCDSIVNFSLLWGFPLLTLTIVTGAIWSANFRHRYWLWEGKETFALVAWTILGIIITARLLRGWRGKKAAYLTILAFAALILRMIGVVL